MGKRGNQVKEQSTEFFCGVISKASYAARTHCVQSTLHRSVFFIFFYFDNSKLYFYGTDMIFSFMKPLQCYSLFESLIINFLKEQKKKIQR